MLAVALVRQARAPARALRNERPATGWHPRMDPVLERKVERFRALPRELRLQALLAQAKRLPPLPPELTQARDHGLGRVEECQTPLYMWVGVEGGCVRIHADAPPEAPTVRGFVGFLVEALDGTDPAAVRDLPEDLMDRMGLTEALGVQRTRGFSAVDPAHPARRRPGRRRGGVAQAPSAARTSGGMRAGRPPSPMKTARTRASAEIASGSSAGLAT